MTAPSHRQQQARRIRTLAGVFAGLFVAVVPVAAVLSAPPQAAGASSEYANAAIADKAMSYVGRWGGRACSDSRKPGDRSGQCRSFVNCIVWMTSGGTQNLGGRDYFRPFLAAGGQEIRSIDELQKGDIVQEGQGRHTFIIVGRVSGNTFNVVDSNHRWNERVSNYDREVQLTYSKRAFRMGAASPTVRLTAAPAPAKPLIGALDTVEAAEGGANVSGWALDADVTRPITVRIQAGVETGSPEDGKAHTAKADLPRMDVAAQYPKYGSSRGFRTFIGLEKGNHVICVYGVNVPNTPGEDLKLGCRAVAVK